MKCLKKFKWVKLPRHLIPDAKGLLGSFLRLASRAAFRKGWSSYCGHQNPVEPGMWAGGIVGIKSITGIRSRQKAIETLELLQKLGYITYTLDEGTKLLTYRITDWVSKCSGAECPNGNVYVTPGYPGFRPGGAVLAWIHEISLEVQMITIKPGSHIHTILTILTLVGEFPMASLGLLGSVRSYGDLIRKLTTIQEFRLPDSNERIQCRLLTVSGKGKRKTLRFFRGGLPLVERWDKERYQLYLREYRDHSFSGNSSHIERNHLIAVAAVMCMGAGIQAYPLAIPPVMEPKIRKLQPEQAYFYFARDLKRVNEYELNKIRSQMPRWMGDGELKIRLHLHSIFTPMINYSYPLREAAVMMGSGYDAALSLLK